MDGAKNMDGEDGEWKGPSAATKWVHSLKNHLEEGGESGVRDGIGLAARVVVEAVVLQPRAGEEGVTSNVTLHYPQPRLIR